MAQRGDHGTQGWISPYRHRTHLWDRARRGRRHQEIGRLPLRALHHDEALKQLAPPRGH
jgi:hypothetical protein